MATVHRADENGRMHSVAAPDPEQVSWHGDDGLLQQARWRSMASHPAPAQLLLVGDELGAAEALRHVRAGTGLLWRGDFQNARHLLQAMARRLDRQLARPGRAVGEDGDMQAVFLAQRQAQALRSRLLGLLLLPVGADHVVPLRRAPAVRAALEQVIGAVDTAYVISLRDLLGLVSAFEWRKNGVPIAALQGRIHPHHGVFSPVRGEYVDLLLRAPWPEAARLHGACDVGTGTGVLAAVLAQRGLAVVATDNEPRALACARDNLARLGLAGVQFVQADLFAPGPGRLGLVLCNPPWVPAPALSTLDAAVYDPDSRMLRGYLAGLAAHLAPGGEGWLILSDLAEHLGLRTRAELLAWVAQGGLRVLGRIDTRPTHRRAADTGDPLHAARAAELTSLWRLGQVIEATAA
jgi:methylase of polypeptide subunit release factors